MEQLCVGVPALSRAAKRKPERSPASVTPLVNAFRWQPDAGRNWDTIRKRDLQGLGMTLAVLEISGLCQSGRMGLHREPVSSSEGGADGLNRCPSWAKMPGVGRRPRSRRWCWL